MRPPIFTLSGLGQVRPKAFFEGTQRTCPPEETLERLRPSLAEMGITRLADITGLDIVGIPVAQAIRPMARSLSVKQGKGATLAAAMASAAVEAAEAWHAETFRPEIRRASARELGATDQVAEVDGLTIRPLPAVDLTLSWVPARNLAGGGTVWLPYECVHLDFTKPAETDLLERSSNGLAGGNTLAGAVLHGLLEVIERDALASFWTLPLDQRRSRRIARAAAARHDPTVAAMLDKIAAAGLQIELFDATNDLGVPAALARLYQVGAASGPCSQGCVPGASLGHGAHLSPAIALSRAVSEAAQSRLTRIAGARDDLAPRHYRPAAEGNITRLMDHVLDRAAHGYRAFDYPDLSAGTAAEDITALLGRLGAAGLDQVLMVDLSRPEIPIHAARIVVPGLGCIVAHHQPQPRRRHGAAMPVTDR